MELNQKIKQIRLLRGMTQKELGFRLGCSEAQICHIEKGTRRLKHGKLLRLENILEFKFDNKIPEYKSSSDRLFDIIKFLFATPDNIKELEEIYKSNDTT